MCFLLKHKIGQCMMRIEWETDHAGGNDWWGTIKSLMRSEKVTEEAWVSAWLWRKYVHDEEWVSDWRGLSKLIWSGFIVLFKALMLHQLVRNMFRQREEESAAAEAAEGRSHLRTSSYNMTVQSTVLIMRAGWCWYYEALFINPFLRNSLWLGTFYTSSYWNGWLWLLTLTTDTDYWPLESVKRKNAPTRGA